MSYSYRLSGSMTIRDKANYQSALQWPDYRHYIGRVAGGFKVMRWVEEITHENTNRGELTVRGAVGIEPASEQAWDDPVSELATAVEICERAGLKLVGSIYAVGEDGPLDTWRYFTVPDGLGLVVVAEQAILVWPNGRRAYEPRQLEHGTFLVLGDDGPVAWPVSIDPDRILRGGLWSR